MKCCVNRIWGVMSLVLEKRKKYKRKLVFLAELLLGRVYEGLLNWVLFVCLVFKKMYLVLGKFDGKWRRGV